MDIAYETYLYTNLVSSCNSI